MWRCPACGAVNRGGTCTECGTAKQEFSRYSPTMSSGRFIILVIAALLIILVAFSSVTAYIQHKHKEKSEAEAAAEAENGVYSEESKAQPYKSE